VEAGALQGEADHLADGRLVVHDQDGCFRLMTGLHNGRH